MPQNTVLPVIKARSENIHTTDTVHLIALFKDGSGTLVDLDSFPHLSIVSPSGSVVLMPTTLGVSKVATGTYAYDLYIGIAGPLGVWNDIWQGTINGLPIEATFSFVVEETDEPALAKDGYYHLGDDVGFNYSQTAIININKLLKILKARLNSSGKVKRKDGYGNDTFIDCDIFSIETLVTFLAAALGEFNQTPFFTFYTFDDTLFINEFYEILVEGATLYALSSQALIERGREFQITDSGISFTPPTVSELLQTQYSSLLTLHWDKLKFIKNSMRPAPIGLGTLTISSIVNPSIARLRHLRSRRFF